MSIYCTNFGIGDEHLPRCHRIRRLGKKLYEQDDSKPCTCGSSPIVYQGSHVLPSNKDKRGGEISLGMIPGHIARRGKDNRKGKRHHWLRVSLRAVDGGDTVLLTKLQVAKLRDELTEWIEGYGA